MNFERKDGRVRLDISEPEFWRLLMLLGYAGGAAYDKGDTQRFYSSLKCANAINLGNPAFDQYEIPAEWADPPERQK